MARMAVRRALRQCPGLHRRSAYILGVELPNDIDTKLYEEALEYEFQSLDPDGPGIRACPEFHYFIDERGKSSYRRKAPFEAFSVGKKLTEHQRFIGIGTPKHPLSDVFRTIAEAVIEVHPEKHHLQAAARIARGVHLSDHLADDLIAHNISSLSIAFRGNRPLKAALGMLEALAVAEASITPKRRDDAEIPPLEEMSGYGEAKKWGLELAHDLKDWSAGALAWSDVDRGVLLLGGPGTGKTIFAKALARSCGATFVECSLSKTQALGHLGDMLGGINKAFREAQKNTPAILFLDEFDGVGNRETLSRHAPEYATQVITGLLELMDGSEKRDGVVIIAACNRLETIDRAFLRPGRLERVIEILPPDHSSRKAIFSQHLMSALPEDDLNEIGRLTEGWTGAELERLARDCRRAARRTGKALDAKQVESTISNTFAKVSERELERFAVHEAGHVVAAYVISGVVATEVVIREYGKTTNGYRVESGGQTTLPVADTGFQVRSDYLDKIAVLLAGHAAEKLFFDEASDGAGLVTGSDLEQATMVAARLVASSGLAKNLVFRAERTDTDLRRILREDPKFTRACDTILRAQSRRAHHVLGQHESILRAISAELGRRKSLARKEIKRLLTLKMDQKSD